MEHTKVIMANEIGIVHWLRFNGSLNPNSSKIGGITSKNHKGSADLFEAISGKSIPINTKEVAVRNLHKRGITKQRKVDKRIVLIL